MDQKYIIVIGIIVFSYLAGAAPVFFLAGFFFEVALGLLATLGGWQMGQGVYP